ncbi:MAG: hypothetical protein WC006_08135 [Bacilli bacterium]|nr:hypothetical protein [Bacilli bacterium]
MKKILFYCSLIISGLIGLSNVIPSLNDPNGSDLVYVFFFVYLIIALLGFIGGFKEIKNDEK